MIRVPFQFEQLPNEILIGIFQYFDARDLFDCFYNLNDRFNTLIKSSTHLNLAFRMKCFNDNDIERNSVFSSYVYRLTVGRAINIDLDQFSSIRNLKLQCPLRRVLAQVNTNTLSHLERLEISQLGVIATIDELCSLPSLRTLKLSCIALLSYKTILSQCLNLVSFQFSIYSSDHSTMEIVPHGNLRRLIIDVLDITMPWNDEIFDHCLVCAPNIERLDVYRTMYMSRINESLLEYDWLVSKINLYLSSIRHFKFYFQIVQSQSLIESNIETILHQIENIFSKNHPNQYHSRRVVYV